jgi:glycosyltransferase involved in cell wall biosynthesis
VGVPAGFETGNAADLTEKLRDLLSRPLDERGELAARARRVAEERWSWAHVADRLLEPFT